MCYWYVFQPQVGRVFQNFRGNTRVFHCISPGIHVYSIESFGTPGPLAAGIRTSTGCCIIPWVNPVRSWAFFTKFCTNSPIFAAKMSEDYPRWTKCQKSRQVMKISPVFAAEISEDYPRWTKCQKSHQVMKISQVFAAEISEDYPRWTKCQKSHQVMRISQIFAAEISEDYPRWTKCQISLQVLRSSQLFGAEMSEDYPG